MAILNRELAHGGKCHTVFHYHGKFIRCYPQTHRRGREMAAPDIYFSDNVFCGKIGYDNEIFLTANGETHTFKDCFVTFGKRYPDVKHYFLF